MKLLLIASAKGGAGKTTAAVRIAETMAQRGIPSGLIDLSPSPTAHWILREKGVFAVPGRGATTLTAAQALLKPYNDRCKLAVLDTGRLDDAALTPWIPLAHAILLVSRVDAHSIASLPTIWQGTESIKRINPAIKFVGILPTMVVPGSERLLSGVQRRFPDWFLQESISHSPEEAALHQAVCFGDGGAGTLASQVQGEWNQVATRLLSSLQLELPAGARAEASRPPATKGMLGRLWQKAAEAIGSRVRVVPS